MKHSFYDVKNREKVEQTIISKVAYEVKGTFKYAFKARTDDGRNLTAFVKESLWRGSEVPQI